jgi:pyruvate formate lyase activating enzyme
MEFGGWQKCSLIDFPGKISAVLFTRGCTFRCPFCHNPSLVLPGAFSSDSVSEEEVLAFLGQRRGKLDGVVISGGEPTIHRDLPRFIRAVRQMGFSIKLDTNGSRPQVVEQLLKEGLVDYWAMDRKASLARYSHLAGVSIDPTTIVRTSQLVMAATDDYEFRTTVIREFHSSEEVLQIAKELQGARRLILQKFRPDVTLDVKLQKATAYTDEEMESFCQSARSYVIDCSWR